jgi:hypothetical protein
MANAAHTNRLAEISKREIEAELNMATPLNLTVQSAYRGLEHFKNKNKKAPKILGAKN